MTGIKNFDFNNFPVKKTIFELLREDTDRLKRINKEVES